MKKMNVLSLFILLSSAQMYSSASLTSSYGSPQLISTNSSSYASPNPELLFVFAAQAANVLDESIVSASEDSVALGIINSMNKFITIAQNLQTQLQAAQAGTFFAGKPVNAAGLQNADNELQKAINGYNKNLKSLRKTAVAVHKKEIDKETKNRNAKQQQLAKNKAALAANTTAQATLASLNTSIQQNTLAFEQALETYISSFGQCYTKPGSISGSITIISSKDNIGEPITPNEFSLLIKTLQAAASQFGSNVSITLALNGGSTTTADISNVISYINNMAPSSASYLTYAAYGLAAVAGTAALIAAANAGYNYNQGQNLTDTTALQGALASAGESLQSFTATQQQNLSAWYNSLPSAQHGSFINWFTSLTPAQQAAELSGSVTAPAAPAGTDYSSYFAQEQSPVNSLV